MICVNKKNQFTENNNVDETILILLISITLHHICWLKRLHAAFSQNQS